MNVQVGDEVVFFPDDMEDADIDAAIASMSGGPASPVALAPQKRPEGGLAGAYNTVVQGTSDAMSSLAGDSFGRFSDDPTQRDDLSPALRTSQALGGNLLPAVGSAIGTAVSESVSPAIKHGLSATLQKMSENKASHPIYGNSDVIGELGRLNDAIPEDYSQAIMEGANIGSIGLPQAKRMTFGDNALAKNAQRLKDQSRRDTIKLLEPDTISARDIEVSPITKRYDYVPQDWEKRMYDEVESVDGFNARGNNVKNVQALDGRVDDIRQELDLNLADGNPISLEDVDEAIESQIRLLADEPLLVGEAENSAKKIYNMFLKELRDVADIDNGTVSPLEVLDARRRLDARLRASSKGIFDPQAVSANTIATRNLRSSINNIVANNAPEGVDVLRALERQSDLLTAADKIDNIVAGESRTGLGRAIDEVELKTGGRPATTPGGAVYNITSPGAVALGTVAGGAALGGRALANAVRATRAGGAKGMQDIMNLLSTPTKKGSVLALLNNEEDQYR